MVYIICTIIGLICIGISIYIRYSKDSRILKENFFLISKRELDDLKKQHNKEIEEEKEFFKKKKKQAKEEYDNIIYNYKVNILEKKNEYLKTVLQHKEIMNTLKEKKEKIENEIILIQNKKINIEETLQNYYNVEEKRIKEKIQYFSDIAINEMTETLLKEQQKMINEKEEVQKELEKYQAMRAAINENIMRERQLQEQSEFFTINLSEQDIADIIMIKELSPRFNNKELLNKIIYESYIKRPLTEMIKRVLNGKSPSGIYKITRKNTGEIYIGRAVAVDKRWVEHVKSAFSIGSIAHSSLHTIMEKDGIWNFTFELLEEVSKDQLNEREKYYIDFYDSKNFGMNQKLGG